MKSIRRILLLASCLGIVLSLAAPCMALTVSEEVEMGEKYMELLRQRMEFIEDPVITREVRRVGANILSVVGPQPFQYRFFVAKENVYNAFAGPGGFVVFNSGLLEALENEDQLAGIVAHEIAHVSCRHISEKISKNSKIQIASAVGMIAGLILGTPVGGALTVGSAAAGQTAALAYSREDEAQADEIGMQYLLKAGYSGKGMVDAMRIMRQKTWFGKDQIPDYMMTHPAVEDRVVSLSSWLDANPQAAQPKRSIDPKPFDKMRMRITALYGDSDLAMGRFAQAAASNPDDALAHYAYGLVLARMSKRSDAVAQLQQALALSPFDADILRDLGRAQYEAGLYNEAISSLSGAVQAAPKVAAGFFWLGRAQMDAGNLEGAVQSIETARELAPNDFGVCYYLGQAYGQKGALDKAHYYLGLYHMDRRDMKNANFHLQKALELSQDNPELLKQVQEAMEKLAQKGKKGQKPGPEEMRMGPAPELRRRGNLFHLNQSLDLADGFGKK